MVYHRVVVAVHLRCIVSFIVGVVSGNVVTSGRRFSHYVVWSFFCFLMYGSGTMSRLKIVY